MRVDTIMETIVFFSIGISNLLLYIKSGSIFQFLSGLAIICLLVLWQNEKGKHKEVNTLEKILADYKEWLDKKEVNK